MERKLYLKICQQAATSPDSKIQVFFARRLWTPDGYQLRFGRDGKAKHTAVLTSKERRCYMHADLELVREVPTTEREEK